MKFIQEYIHYIKKGAPGWLYFFTMSSLWLTVGALSVEGAIWGAKILGIGIFPLVFAVFVVVGMIMCVVQRKASSDQEE